jgi:hypothetical protein
MELAILKDSGITEESFILKHKVKEDRNVEIRLAGQ